jgi:hypothetical protein
MTFKRPIQLVAMTLFVSVAITQAAEPLRVAVVDITSENVRRDALAIISDRLRNKLYETEYFTVIERQKMEEIIGELGYSVNECFDQSCVVEIGRLLQAEAMIFGSLGKIGTLHMLQIRMVDVESGRTIGTSTRECRCDLEEVAVRLVDEASTDLAAALVGVETAQGQGNGIIRIESTPAGGRVFLDGQPRRGKTPLVLERIPAGNHTVRVEKEWLFGELQVTVQPDRVERAVVPLRPGTGTLYIWSAPPDVEVHIGGRQRGVTPLLMERMEAGPAEVELRLRGFYPHKQQVTVPRDGREELRVTMKRIPTTTMKRKKRGKVTLLFGAAALGAGIYFDRQASAAYRDRKDAYTQYQNTTVSSRAEQLWVSVQAHGKEGDRAVSRRNVMYGVGAGFVFLGALWTF